MINGAFLIIKKEMKNNLLGNPRNKNKIICLLNRSIIKRSENFNIITLHYCL